MLIEDIHVDTVRSVVFQAHESRDYGAYFRNHNDRGLPLQPAAPRQLNGRSVGLVPYESASDATGLTGGQTAHHQLYHVLL